MDIVAREGETIVFVEVKTREGRAFGGGGDAITGHKRRRIVRLGLDYLMRHHLTECPCRFDVVLIEFDTGEPVITIISHAFDAGTA